MAEFYSRNNLPKTIPQPKCDKLVPTYGRDVDESGKVHIVQTGKTNVYEKIQASKEDCLIYNILDRFAAGDVGVLNVHQGQYGDFTEMPKTLAEAQQTLIDAENYFNSLPLDVRKEFDHNVGQFLSSAAGGKLSERHAYFKPPEVIQEAMKQNAAQVAQQEQIVHNVQGGSVNE